MDRAIGRSETLCRSGPRVPSGRDRRRRHRRHARSREPRRLPAPPRVRSRHRLHVVSGKEEARLIYLGVSSGLHLESQQALFIDIGGGSTETSIGTQREALYLNSLKVGAIRLSNQFLRGMTGPVTQRLYERIKVHVRNEAARTLHDLRQNRIDLAYGSSGTIENLADIASQAQNRQPSSARRRAVLPTSAVPSGCSAPLRWSSDATCQGSTPLAPTSSSAAPQSWKR